MNLDNGKGISVAKYLILLPIMGLAFYIAFMPHQSYPYPVHIDEWMHMACANEILSEASAIHLSSPFSGEAPIWNQSVQVGFHLLCAIFYQISGIEWATIVRYLPGVIFMMTVLSVYVMARRHGFGWEAAFFTCLIPTTVGILGPAFLVPVAMGLLFIPLIVFLAFNLRTLWSYLAIFIFTVFLLSMHAATAVGIIIILLPYILLNLKDNLRHSLGITLALAVPFILSVIALPWIFDILLTELKSLFSPTAVTWYVDIPRLIQAYGYLPLLTCLLGVFVLATRWNKRDSSLVLGLLALLLMLVVFFTFHYGLATLYERGLVYTMLLMSMVAGAGLMAVHNLKIPENIAARIKVPVLTNNIGIVLCIALVALTLFTTIPERKSTPYYHMISGEDSRAFTWIKDNVGDSYQKAILDPWKATAFTAVTGKYVYTRIHLYPTPVDNEAYQFLNDGCLDTAFLREHGISIVYTKSGCQNPDLVEIRKNVYLLHQNGQNP